jgi:phosphoglycolate phosphatase
MLTVGFDLDMTLVDSRPGVRASLAALTRETGVAIDIDIVIARLGPKLEWELGQWFPDGQVAYAAERYRAHYWEHCAGEGTLPLPGGRSSVDAVRARGGRVIVITAKAEQHARRCLDNVGLVVDDVIGRAHGDEKRDACLQHAVKIYVGDTAADVRSGVDAGVIAVGVTTGPDERVALERAGATVVVASLEEFPSLLDTLI